MGADMGGGAQEELLTRYQVNLNKDQIEAGKQEKDKSPAGVKLKL